MDWRRRDVFWNEGEMEEEEEVSESQPPKDCKRVPSRRSSSRSRESMQPINTAELSRVMSRLTMGAGRTSVVSLPMRMS